MGELKKMRTEKKMTQQQVADLVGISLRSYKSYENDEKKQGSLKYKYIFSLQHSPNYHCTHSRSTPVST